MQEFSDVVKRDQVTWEGVDGDDRQLLIALASANSNSSDHWRPVLNWLPLHPPGQERCWVRALEGHCW